MAVLPEGTALPPTPYLLGLVVAGAVVGGLLYRDRPRIDDRTVLALAPWMAVGAALYVAYQLDLVPGPLAPLASSPTVYASVGVVAGATWLVVRRVAAVPLAALAGVGATAALFVAGTVAGYGLRNGTLSLGWPLAAVGGAVVLTAVVWAGLRRVAPGAAATTRAAGPLVVFAHALDGVSTAVGYDVMGFGERSPLSRELIEFAAGLPTEAAIGAGWLFVVVKLTLAALAIYLLAAYAYEEPDEGFLVLAFVTAVGFGPGVHNVLLFAAVG